MDPRAFIHPSVRPSSQSVRLSLSVIESVRTVRKSVFNIQFYFLKRRQVHVLRPYMSSVRSSVQTVKKKKGFKDIQWKEHLAYPASLQALLSNT